MLEFVKLLQENRQSTQERSNLNLSFSLFTRSSDTTKLSALYVVSVSNENRHGCEPPFSPRERQGVLLDNVHIEHLFVMVEIDEDSACHRDKIASLFRNIIFFLSRTIFTSGSNFQVCLICVGTMKLIPTHFLCPLRFSISINIFNWSCSYKHHISPTLVFSLMLRTVANLSYTGIQFSCQSVSKD